MRGLVAILCLAVAAFCAFGLVASFEPGSNALSWRIGYGVVLVACLVGAVRLLAKPDDR